MADNYADISNALVAADKAGDTQSVQVLLKEIDRLKNPARLGATTPDDPTSHPNPAEGMSTGQQLAAGVGKSIVDAGRGIGQFTPLVSRQDVADSRRRDSALMSSQYGPVGDASGAVGMALLPGGLLKGAGKIGGSAALDSVGGAMLAPRTIPQAIGLGAGMGAAQPSTSTGETLLNMGLGAAGNSAIPVAQRGASIFKSLTEPLHAEGQDAIIARLLKKTAGGEANDVAARLHGAFEPMIGPQPANRMQPVPGQLAGEIVPGSIPTLAQVAQNPGIGAMERTVAQTDPAQALMISKRLADQNRARLGILEDMSGEGGARQAALDARDKVAGQQYGAAREADIRRQAEAVNSQINKDAPNVGLGSLGNTVSRGQQESAAVALRPSAVLEELNKRPAFKSYVDEARKLAANHGMNIGNPMESVQGLHYIKLAIDDALSPTATSALGNNAKAATMDMKNQLLKEIEKISPEYESARANFTTASKPINQMEVAQAIKDKSVSPLTETIRPESYARALTDDTARNATGFKQATLSGTMSQEQMNALNAIKADLARAKAAENVGRGPGSDTVQKLAYSNMVDAAGVPNWVRAMKVGQVAGNLAGRGANVLYGDANKQMAQRLAEVLAQPDKAAELLGLATKPDNKALANALRLAGTGATPLALKQAGQMFNVQ